MPTCSSDNSGLQSTVTLSQSQDETSAYRAFRQRQLETEYARWRLDEGRSDLPRRTRYGYDEAPRRGLAYGRRIIKAFRESVASGIDELCAPRSPDADFARRALGIPDHVPVRLSWPAKIGVFLATGFFPVLALRLAADRLREVGTPEGRELIFDRLAGPALLKTPYYGDGLDFIVRKFTVPRSHAVLEQLQYFDVVTARNAWRLGIETAEELQAVFCGMSRSFPQGKLAVLIDLQVIRSVDELHWLESWREQNHGYNWDVESTDGGPQVIRRLLEHGVPRRATLKVLKFWRHCDPAGLDLTLRTLGERGAVDVAHLFELLVELLWKARPRNWHFVIDVIGAKEPEQWPLFSRVLEVEALPNEETVDELRTRGASLDDLSGLQSLMLQMRERDRDPRRSIDLLCSPPHSLGFNELVACRAYVIQRSDDDLASFLGVLERYGFGAPAGVLAFQHLYANGVASRNLDRLLSMYCALRNTSSVPETVAEWVGNIGANRIDAFEYLVSILPVPDLPAFDEVRQLAQIDRSLLEYAAEARKLRTVHALRAWQRASRGIEQVGWVSWQKPVSRLLLDDACARGNCFFVQGNLAAVSRASSAACRHLLGQLPFNDEPACTIYWRRWHALELDIEVRILPGIQPQLDATGGMLAASLIGAYLAGAQEYERQLAAFRVEVESLLRGQGPSGAALSQLEAEAVTAVYGIELGEGDQRWSRAAGLVQHLDHLVKRNHYMMKWRRKPVELKRPIDSAGLRAIRAAIGYGATFRREADGDMSNACYRLSPKQLRDCSRQSVSPQTFHRHLGVLLGVIPADRVDRLLTHIETLEMHANDVDRRHAAAKQVADFFDVELHDAISEHGTTVAARLTEEAAGYLVMRLAGAPVADDSRVPRDRLIVVLGEIGARARGIYGTWAHRQVSAFKGRPSEKASEVEYQSSMSKYPAAYFAKVATKLCSADNVRMWREERQSHLVVFNPVSRRLVGMAMLYVERIDPIDPHRATLVMRAINTVNAADAQYEADSVVQSFVEVGIQIAQDNDLAAMAFPADDDGQHYMSNRDDMYRYVEKICARAVDRRTAFLHMGALDGPEKPGLPYCVALDKGDTFYGYERGNGPVSKLYVIWQAPLTRATEAQPQSGTSATTSLSGQRLDRRPL